MRALNTELVALPMVNESLRKRITQLEAKLADAQVRLDTALMYQRRDLCTLSNINANGQAMIQEQTNRIAYLEAQLNTVMTHLKQQAENSDLYYHRIKDLELENSILSGRLEENA